MSFSARVLRLGLCGLASLIGSCDSLFGQYGVDNPSNCVVNSGLCQAPDQACNPVTRDCEPAILVSAIDPPAAATRGGELATLTGQRFTPDLRLRIGDREVAAVNVISDRSLSFVVPPGPSPAGPVTIEVSHPAGQTQRRTDLFRYYDEVQLSAPQPVTMPFVPKYFRVADFNGDKRLDVLLTDSFGSEVTVLPGQGDGSFAAPVTSSFSGRAYGLGVGDCNGDGILDIAVSLTGPTSTVEVSLGNGDGSFRTAVPVTLQTTIGSIALGDFDGDGRADLAAADDVKLRIWRSNGDGTFATPSTDMPLSYQGFGTSGRLHAVDLDGDMRMDLVAVNGRDFSFPMLFGLGNGTFSEIQSPIYAGTVTAATVGDADGDGLLDVLTTHSQVSGTVDLSLQGSGRSFKVPAVFTISNNITNSEIVDLNGDRAAEILAFSSFGTAGAFVIAHGVGAGRFATPRTYSLPPFPQVMIIGQFDGDTRPDVLIAHRSSGGTGSFYSVLRNATP